MRRRPAFLACVLLSLAGANAQAVVPTIGGCPVFPARNIWSTRIDKLPVHASSSSWISQIAAAQLATTPTWNGNIRADWGSTDPTIGIPYVTVTGSQPAVPISYDPLGFGDESDPGPFPIPADAPVEGGAGSGGDQHVIVIDTTNCVLYELYLATAVGGGASWSAYSGARFDLRSHGPLRPLEWTSADAAGLPIFPGLVRWDEVAAGEINHAIRVTFPDARNQYAWPARHRGPSSKTASNIPIYGSRARLKASFDITGFDPSVQVILRALKKYGFIFADQGSAWFFQGMSNPNWTSIMLNQIKSISAANFEFVDTASLQVDVNSGLARQVGTSSYGDTNADGTTDLVWRNSADGSTQAWLMNGLTATSVAGLLGAGSGWSVTHLADLDGDGKADMLLRNTDGTVVAWIMNGLGVASSATFVGAGSGWSIIGSGDLDGDGKADLVWQHTNGAVQAWLMNGTSVTGIATFVAPGSGWTVARIADLNGDGKSDLIWQHTDGSVQAWTMNGLAASGIASFAAAGSGWSVKLTADLNGDGKSDLVWQHTDGSVQAWLMNGLAASGIATFSGAASGWTPVLAGDIDGDGKSDLCWTHSDGRSQAWLMNGLSVNAVASWTGTGNTWVPTHMVDLDGDGRSDMLWRNSTGAVQAWLMSGLVPAGVAQLAGPGAYAVVPAQP